MESEKATEAYLVAQVKALGGWAIKIPAGFFAGFPDRAVLMPRGRVYFAELKSEGKKPTPIQLKCHERLRGLGFGVWVIDTKQGVRDFLEFIQLLS